GHVVNSKGVSVEEEKISAVRSWHVPSTVKEVRVLRLPDFSKPFIIECDASSDGVGVILSQEDHPLAYFSKGFSPSNRFKSAYDRELLALVMAQRITSIEQQRLLLKLMPYDFSIIHKAGKENKGADALSHRPHSGKLLTLIVPYCVKVTDIKAGLQTDPFTNHLISKLNEDSSSVTDFSLVNQLLFYQGRFVILEVSSLRLKLLQEAHDTQTGGHGGFLKTYKRLSSRYYWPKMKQDVRNFAQECVLRQQQKYQTLSPAGLLQPLPIPNQIWEDISMYFIVGLPPSIRFDTILVVVDRLSKYAHFLTLSHPFTAKGVTTVFCKEIGKPKKPPKDPRPDENQPNLKRQELTFLVGDYVFLKIQPYRQKSLAKCRYEKLSPRFFGPYLIKRIVGSVAYELELPPEAKIHPVFHVSMLKPARGTFSSLLAAPLPITKEWEIDLQPSSVVTHHWVYEAGCPNLELLVSWCNRPIEESTWETYDLVVAEQFPAFCLEDKAFYREGSNDKDTLKVYSRKRNRVKAANMELNYIFGNWLNPLGQNN
ncbi:ty3-gypsy retrotransposon protein, partial [Tanacetum coccineum]